jgi:hypothetical protein
MKRRHRLVLVVVWYMSFCFAAGADGGQFEVVHVTEVVRHGDSSLHFSYLASPPIDGKYAGLSSNGMRMMYLLGLKLREQYPMLFDQPLNLTRYDIISAAEPSTVQSANSHLLGLFPLGSGMEISVPSDSQYLLPALLDINTSLPLDRAALPGKYQPFPVSTSGSEYEKMLIDDLWSTKGCPGFRGEYNKHTFHDNTRYSTILRQLMEQLENSKLLQPNIKLRSMRDAYMLHREIEAYEEHFRTLPDGLSLKTRLRIQQVASLALTRFFSSNLVYAYTHHLLLRIITGLKALTKPDTPDNPAIKFRLFSGFDTTIMSLYNVLNQTSVTCLEKILKDKHPESNCRTFPRFGESVIFEVSRGSGRLYLRLLINGEAIRVCSSGEHCPIEEFIELLEKNIKLSEDEFEELCKNPFSWDGLESSPMWYRYYLVVCTVLIILFGILLCFLIANPFGITRSSTKSR